LAQNLIAVVIFMFGFVMIFPFTLEEMGRFYTFSIELPSLGKYYGVLIWFM
jgi:hypothetical protein